MDVTIKVNPRDLRRVNQLLEAYPKRKGQVMSRAINKTSLSARGKIVKELSAKTKLTGKTIRGALRLYKATYTRWQSTIRIAGRGMSLLRFKARQTKRGVTYIDPGSGSRTLLPHGFIATMPKGGSGVFVRLTPNRLPIEKQYGPSLGQIYEGASGVAARIQRETGRDLTKNIMTQVRLVLQKARGA